MFYDFDWIGQFVIDFEYVCMDKIRFVVNLYKEVDYIIALVWKVSECLTIRFFIFFGFLLVVKQNHQKNICWCEAEATKINGI